MTDNITLQISGSPEEAADLEASTYGKWKLA